MLSVILFIGLINSNFIINNIHTGVISIKKNIENYKILNNIKKNIHINDVIDINHIIDINHVIDINHIIDRKKISYIYNNIDILKNINNIQHVYKYNNIDIYNEFLFLLNLKTKVYINISKIIPYTNIYHIGIMFRTIKGDDVYELSNDLGLHFLEIIPHANEYEEIFWGYTNKTLQDIYEYEKTLNNNYILGLYDCRHYTRDLSKWTTHNPTPVWKLKDIVNNNI
tara:strand:- start:295 stop:972 length:678 start_codon:yes stop_codon:yes gene_type:complete